MKKRLSLVAVFSLLAVTLASCKAKYTIEFVEKNGTEICDTIEVKEGSQLTLPTPTKDGLTFDGWYTDPGFDEEFTDETMPAESLVLYAKWVATLTFDAKGGTECMSITNTPNSFAQLPETTKDGYVFGGWYQDEACTIEQKNVVPSKHATVYAKWQVKNDNTYYPFTNWRDNDGSAYVIEKDAEGTTIVANENKGEWSFAYDLINIDGTGFRVVELTFVGTKDCEAIIKLEGGDAQAVEKRIKFTGELQTETWVVKASNVSTVPGQKLMIFLNAGNKGHVKTSGDNPVYFEEAPYIQIKSCGLYQPQDIGVTSDVYAIHYNSNGGDTIASVYAKAGSTVTSKAPKKDGYAFGGWYTDAALTQEFDGVMPTQSTLLYAKWHEIVDMTGDRYTCDTTTATEKADADKAIVYAYANGALTISKTSKGGDWTCVASKTMGDVLTGATKATVVLTGPAGKKVLVKINDAYEAMIECTGEKQTVEIDLAGKTFDPNKTAVLIFPEAGGQSTDAQFVIESITVDGTTPVDLAASTFECGDNMTYVSGISTVVNKGVLTVSKLNGVGAWVCTKSTLLGKDIAGSGKLYITIKGEAGKKILFKVNDVNAGEIWVECTGETQTVVFDFSHLEINKKNLALVMFPEGDTEGTGAEFAISNLYFIKEVDLVNSSLSFNAGETMKVEKAEEDLVIKYAYADGALTVSKTSKGSEWTNMASNVMGDALEGATTATVVLTGPEGKQILVKINDAYETWVTCTGAEQTVTIDLTGKTFNPNNTALVLFPEGSKASTGAEFVIKSIAFNSTTPVELVDKGFTCGDNYQYVPVISTKYENDILTVSKLEGAGEWSNVSTVLKGSDIAAYSRMEVVVKGEAGKQILLKINDQKEVWVTCTGEDQVVVIDYSDLKIAKAKPALVMFPEGGKAATGAAFEIKNIVLSQYKAVELPLISANGLTDTYTSNQPEGTSVEVKEDGSIAIAKISDSSNYEWAYVKSSFMGSDIANYTTLTLTVKGTEGEQVLVKIANALEQWVTCTGAEQTVVVDYSSITVDPNQVALLLFPGAGKNATTGEFVISNLVWSTYKLSTNLLTDTYTSNQAAGTNVEVKEDGSIAISKISDSSDYEWAYVKSASLASVLEGYTKLIVTVKGTEGEQVLVKIANALEQWVTCTGAEQTVVIDYSSITVDANQVALLFFPGAGKNATTGEFVISQIALSNVNPALNVLTDTYTALDADTYTITPEEGKLTIKKIGTGAWQFGKGTLTGKDIVGYTKLTATVTGKAGQKITFKVNDQLEYAVEFATDGTQTVEIKFQDLTINEGAAALLFFVNGGVEAQSEDFVITQLVFGN